MTTQRRDVDVNDDGDAGNVDADGEPRPVGRGVFDGAEVVVLPPLLHLHLPGRPDHGGLGARDEEALLGGAGGYMTGVGVGAEHVQASKVKQATRNCSLGAWSPGATVDAVGTRTL